ncbi:MAG TPA: hypothetical protein DHU69_08490 [Deltaproteobacteria bacterium]|nr:MAG: hypothetical protein A2090_00650 [Deltaproteobacteria bacterium GWD2_42_10]OGP48028.1 MAG: hypothetical protein A2022_11410 [Deltaproteobacteria bacterium GWF2_42_12]OGQ30485.1 MAG: hypothetical protein A3D29_05265 [Deltaproteobacteria bacterium RIFCSPHIGHO2_02_FULL_42_44]OGQ35725.1 MAG: hypothetical protein A3H47_07235 [Deltaproteobacteria bacterium RIFCSPLOWO2_02_FULL_42_39]OGQ70407.1 MAG: hypothetical protein A3F88_10890 [Deltaproteobacteria bacterium RIFCSPLOWO2_12_FULL_42_16]OGQ72
MKKPVVSGRWSVVSGQKIGKEVKRIRSWEDKKARILNFSISQPLIFCLLLFTVFFGCSQDPALPLYEKAEEYFSKMDYLNAVEGYSSVVSKYPESSYAPTSQYKIGFINSHYLKNVSRAMNAYATLILLYPKSKEVILARQDLADIYINSGDYRRAIGEYQWLMENAGIAQRDDYHYQIAAAYLKLTDLRQARIEFQEIVKNSPNSQLGPQVYYQIANTYYLEGNCQDAIKAYENVALFYPSSPFASEAKLGKAMCIEEMGNLTEAVELYRELEKSYPNPDIIRVRIEGIESRENKTFPIALKEN